MVQLLGIFFKGDKKFYLEIQRIYGIGSFRSKIVCKRFGISLNTPVKHIDSLKFREIKEFLEKNYLIGVDLRKEKAANIKRLSNNHSYRGTRHRYFLPVRGQRTHTNARTRKQYNPNLKKRGKVKKKVKTKPKKFIKKRK
jgi:small subunit ribosomal protein S13